MSLVADGPDQRRAGGIARSRPRRPAGEELRAHGTASPQFLAIGENERHTYFRRIAEAQLRAWEPAVAWTYWSYKLLTADRAHDPWDLGRAIELGWLRDDLVAPAV